jgi:hypothetical protein
LQLGVQAPFCCLDARDAHANDPQSRGSFDRERFDEVGKASYADALRPTPFARKRNSMMATRQRDYRKEYARRVAVAAQKGLSRSAARGRPRAGERIKRATGRTVDPNSREERALKMMRHGASLRDAAGHFRMSQERMRAYLKETTGATRENGRWKIADHRSRQFPFYSDGAVVTLG